MTYDENESIAKDPDMRCSACKSTFFMELYQVELDEYVWRCECGHEEVEDYPEKILGYKRDKK